MAKKTLGLLVTQEALLETEKLMQEQVRAEGSTPQAYEAFVKKSEQEGQEYREEHKDDPAPGEDDMDIGGDMTPVDGGQEGGGEGGPQEPAFEDMEGDEEAEGGLEVETQQETQTEEVVEETNEALDSWIREKTQGSDSAVVRNAGELTAGLAHLGIKYGPGTLEAVSKGSLWAFSRIGDGIVAAMEATGEFIEKSRNSVDKLEARLKQAETVIIDQLNSGQKVPSLTYKKTKILAMLKVGSDLNIAGNLRIFAGGLTASVNSIAAEVESGIQAVERLSNSDSKSRANNLEAFMKVDPPRKGFRRGGPGGYQIKSMMNELWSTDPLWPGDVALIFVRPKNSTNLNVIAGGYKHADMYVSSSTASSKVPPPLSGMNATDLVMIVKSARLLIAACREVTKTQQRMAKLDESYGNIAKRMFYSIADEGSKSSESALVAQMLHLRTNLATKVFTKGVASAQTHASRVLAATVHLLEDYAKRMTSEVQTEA